MIVSGVVPVVRKSGESRASLVAGALPLLGAILVLLGSGCTSLESPSDRARSALERLSSHGFSIPVDAGVSIDVPAGKLVATAVDAGSRKRGTLEAFGQLAIEGRVDGIPLSYVGNEKFLVSCSTTCSVDGALAPRLADVVRLLRARRAALHARDPAAVAALSSAELPSPTADELAAADGRGVAAWFIRVEGDSAVVGEAAVDGKQKRLALVRADGAWRFESGLP
ncbi:hypothetical protein [Vulgatibacter incomptus]|uniref:Uncharacterized protein n=1 Tax=Vulgatibacter incomptus TaxID=1391653 RepID=A0A0K1P9L6_9BACT|nr:hypothetical protein [Vulgatibacter incomptus]AKU90218.1 hypothetical protein AKJ08_0605 [Vulgatibacter incomptus]